VKADNLESSEHFLPSRRSVLKSMGSVAVASALTAIAGGELQSKALASGAGTNHRPAASGMSQTMLGAYGVWAAGVVGEGPGRLSFRQPRFRTQNFDAWRRR
jgi:hypothetical protein